MTTDTDPLADPEETPGTELLPNADQGAATVPAAPQAGADAHPEDVRPHKTKVSHARD